MQEYHKIQTLFKRNMDGPKKGKMIRGEWTTPALAYLADNEWEFTEKVDGTNIRVHIRRHDDLTYVEFGGRTDRAMIPKPLQVYLEETFPETSPRTRTERGDAIGEWMLDNDLTEVMLFGEGYGPKIENGGKYRDDASFILFDVMINGFWLNRDNVNDVAKKLGIDSVPVLGYGTLHRAIEIVSSGITFSASGSVERWGSKGLNSRVASKDVEAEGIVARPRITLFDNQGKRIITKIKAVDFR